MDYILCKNETNYQTIDYSYPLSLHPSPSLHKLHQHINIDMYVLLVHLTG